MRFRFLRVAFCIASGLCAVGLASTPVVAIDPAFVITIDAAGHAVVNATGAMATLRTEATGQRYTFDLSLADDYTTAEVRVEGGIDVERPQQLVPEVDDSAQHPGAEHLHPHFFVAVSRDVADVDEPAHIVNFTGSGSAFTTHLGFIGPGASVLTLTRDVEAPFYQVDDAVNITDHGFLVTSRSSEFAYGDLQVWRPGATVLVQNPIAVPTLEQAFPIIGLAANTTYAYHIVFTDWAGNSVTSDEFQIHTMDAPVRVAPILVSREPPANATVGPGARIAATFESPSAIPFDGFRFFLDKIPTLDDLAIEGVINAPDQYVLVYTAGAPSAAGLHTVGFEATNEAGGTAHAQWRFFVAGSSEDQPGLPVPILLATLLAAAVAVRWRARA